MYKRIVLHNSDLAFLPIDIKEERGIATNKYKADTNTKDYETISKLLKGHRESYKEETIVSTPELHNNISEKNGRGPAGI